MPDAVATQSAPARPPGAYQEHAPPAALAQYIECFWSRGGAGWTSGAQRSHRVLPDGCADIVLAFDAGCGEMSAAAVGTMTRPALFADSGRTSYVGVRFRPGVAGVLFGLPARELTDQRPDLIDLWPQAGALTDSLAGAPDRGTRIKILSAEIARRLLAAPVPVPRTVSIAVARIAASRGRISIQRLASELGVSRQHLARSFAHHAGLSPKLLARIVRARGVVDLAREGADVDWTSLAFDAGYYDQSHLIAEIKELTGLSPSAWTAWRV